jgi:hypothetical protein
MEVEKNLTKRSGAGGSVSNRHLRDGAPAHCRGYATPARHLESKALKVEHRAFVCQQTQRGNWLFGISAFRAYAINQPCVPICRFPRSLAQKAIYRRIYLIEFRSLNIIKHGMLGVVHFLFGSDYLLSCWHGGHSPSARLRNETSTVYLALARTSVTSSGCSLSPIQSSTAVVTIWLICGSGKSRFSRTRSINLCSPNSPKSFSGSVTPSL